MKNLLLREKLAIQLIARDDKISCEAAYAMWSKWKAASSQGHKGDCTGQPEPCARCVVEMLYRDADDLLALIKEAGYVKLAADQDCPPLPMTKTVYEIGLYEKAQQDMLKAGFRKVKL